MGSLIDNLHITPDRRRTGIGTALLTCAAEADAERATGKSTYLSVLEQNTFAQQFYRTFGSTRIERPQCRPRRRSGPTQRLPQQAPLYLARRHCRAAHHPIQHKCKADHGDRAGTAVLSVVKPLVRL